MKREVSCGKFSVEFNSVKIAGHRERPALKHGQIHVEKLIPPLRGLFNESPAEGHAKRGISRSLVLTRINLKACRVI